MLIARSEALAKHGELKPGPKRWLRLIAEEWWEAQVELHTLGNVQEESDKREAIVELAQLAQLCIGVIELIQEGSIAEVE